MIQKPISVNQRMDRRRLLSPHFTAQTTSHGWMWWEIYRNVSAEIWARARRWKPIVNIFGSVLLPRNVKRKRTNRAREIVFGGWRHASGARHRQFNQLIRVLFTHNLVHVCTPCSHTHTHTHTKSYISVHLLLPRIWLPCINGPTATPPANANNIFGINKCWIIVDKWHLWLLFNAQTNAHQFSQNNYAEAPFNGVIAVYCGARLANARAHTTCLPSSESHHIHSHCWQMQRQTPTLLMSRKFVDREYFHAHCSAVQCSRIMLLY